MHARIYPTLYQQLQALPDGLIGEILDGQLHTQPRPSGPHALAALGLGAELFGPFHRGRGGPGGWWILAEPELHLVRDQEVVVPDLGGWRRERMSSIPSGHRFEVVPDWVCEILSSSTESRDREIKFPIYARYGVTYAWLIDPRVCTIEAYASRDDAWIEVGRYHGSVQAKIPPFDAVAIDLGALWDDGGSA